MSHGMRLDVKLILLFNEDIYISFLSNMIRNLYPDMQSILGILRKAEIKLVKSSANKYRISTGIYCGKINLNLLLHGEHKIFFNETKGPLIEKTPICDNFIFVICYPYINQKDMEFLLSRSAKPIRISSKYKLPGPILMIINNYVDKVTLKYD